MLHELIAFIIELIAMTIVFYVAGVIVVGQKRALLSDAFVISLLGTVVSTICLLFFPVWVALPFDGVFRINMGVVLSVIGWLLLIRYYYETGWLGALAVGILAIIIFIVILLILAPFLVLSLLLF